MPHKQNVDLSQVKIDNVIPEQLKKIYFGISDTELKTRINKHICLFRNFSHEKGTKLLEYVFGLKDQGKAFPIRRSIFKTSSGYIPVSKSCKLCNSKS